MDSSMVFLSWSVLEAFRILKITGYDVELEGLSGLGEKMYSIFFLTGTQKLIFKISPGNYGDLGRGGRKTGETCAFKILKVTF